MHNTGVSGRLRNASGSERCGVSQTLIPLNLTSSSGRQFFAYGKKFSCLYLVLESNSGLQSRYGSERIIPVPDRRCVDLASQLGYRSQVASIESDVELLTSPAYSIYHSCMSGRLQNETMAFRNDFHC